ncbi:hypothetical protein SBBP1_490040 [Burkholderiales bacterium]|nr:hypothetical protein SBBP1_490040 [Burkholderiales bacterium]
MHGVCELLARKVTHRTDAIRQPFKFLIESFHGVWLSHSDASGVQPVLQPNRPVMYSSVCLFPGLANLSSVGPDSTSSPKYLKPVKLQTRAACCLLWVTTAIV